MITDISGIISTTTFYIFCFFSVYLPSPTLLTDFYIVNIYLDFLTCLPISLLSIWAQVDGLAIQGEFTSASIKNPRTLSPWDHF